MVNSIYVINDYGRECSVCQQFKPWDDFHKRNDGPHGHRSACKICVNAPKRKPGYWSASRIDENGRECNFCHTYKPYSEFSKKENCPYGYYTICKKCNATKRRLKKYNLTIDQYNELLQEFGGKCAICGKEETAITSFSGQVKSLAIDHCHESGRVRGMLCSRCNTAIGKVKDSISHLRKLLDYIENNLDLEHSERQVSINDRDCTLQYLYGITLQEYNEILESQNGACAICGIIPDYGKDLGVDHDHKTGKVRGLLCVNCNTAVGLFQDSPDIMRQAIEYLT